MSNSLKEVCHEIFDAYIFHDLNPSRPLINRLKYFRIRFQFRRDIWSQISKNLTQQCASKIIFFIKFFSLLIDVFTPKSISPDCPFKSNQRLKKISILTLRCAVWLRGEMHTPELFEKFWLLDSMVGCTVESD